MLWTADRGNPHSFPEDRWVGKRRESFRLGMQLVSCPLGTQTSCQTRPLWDASYAWGLGLLEALYHHHRRVGVARTSEPRPLFYPQGSPSSARPLPETLCSYYRQNVLFFWLWGEWAGEVPGVLWQGRGACQRIKPPDRLHGGYSLSPGGPVCSPKLQTSPPR